MSDETTPQTPDEPVEGAPTPQPPQTGLDIEVEHYVLPEGAADKVEPVDLESEMKRSYLDYAMAVIVGRALPDVRDGLKPVHRRVLYAMYDGGYRPDRAFNKSARVVGDVMGNYHPHGDTAIYDALVRLIQDWVQRYPLALGQGNFGSPGNDGAAAQRYTETKMAPLAMEMVRDIDEDTVDMQDNYDGKQQEPVVLPARYPNLLVNGSSGIAVGMATNIPPHNMREVAAGVQWYLEHPEATREELLEFAEFVKVRAALAWQPNAPRTPGDKQCMWCKVKATCADFAVLQQELTEGVFDNLDETVDEQKVIKLIDDLEDPFEDYKVKPSPVHTLTTAQLEQLLPWRKVVENWWKSVEDELEKRLQNGTDCRKFKLVECRSNRSWRQNELDAVVEDLDLMFGLDRSEVVEEKVISPSALEELLIKKGFKRKALPDLMKPLTVKPRGKPTMAPIHDKRPALTITTEDVFDDLDADDGSEL